MVNEKHWLLLISAPELEISARQTIGEGMAWTSHDRSSTYDGSVLAADGTTALESGTTSSRVEWNDLRRPKDEKGGIGR